MVAGFEGPGSKMMMPLKPFEAGVEGRGGMAWLCMLQPRRVGFQR